MRHEIKHSLSTATSAVSIVVYLKDDSEENKKKCEAAIQAALPNVNYSLQPAMVGSEGMPEDEYNMLGTYTATITDRKDERYPDRHPGNSELEVKVRVFSGHHSTLEQMLAEYRQRGESRLVDLGAMLGTLGSPGLPLLAVSEHLQIYRKNVLGL